MLCHSGCCFVDECPSAALVACSEVDRSSMPHWHEAGEGSAAEKDIEVETLQKVSWYPARDVEREESAEVAGKREAIRIPVKHQFVFRDPSCPECRSIPLRDLASG